MANVFLPASLAAARYMCNAEYTKVVDTTKTFTECCSQSGAAGEYDHYSAEHAESRCSIDEACDHALTSDFSDTSVIFPATQQFSAPLVSSVSFLISLQEYSFKPLAVEAAVPFFKPPLYLLNSVFLN